MAIYRHGDVNLVEVSELEYQAAKTRGQVLPKASAHILARGEATNSVHLLTVEHENQMELVQDGDTLWLVLTAPGTLTHTSDHEPLTIAPKWYRQVPEREMDWFGNVVRRVVD